MSLFTSYYHASGSLSAGSNRTRIVTPDNMLLKVGTYDLEQRSSQSLDINNDSSWDFGQSISTWQPNTAYTLGQWVRPSSSWIANGANNTRTDYATKRMRAATCVGQVAGATSTDGSYYPYGAFGQYTELIWRSSVAPETTPQSLYIDTGTSLIINKYAMQAIGSATTDFPLRWTLEASNSSSSGLNDTSGTNGWVVLHTQSSDATDPGNSGWTPYLTFSNSIGYRYFRVRITKSTRAAYAAIQELKLVAQPAIVYKCTTAGTSHSSTEPTWPLTSTVSDESAVWTAYNDTTRHEKREGTDFYTYTVVPATGRVPKLVMSSNSTLPHGYTTDNSRKIGGFHCLCLSVGIIASHDLSGYITGDILPKSIWDLKHRCLNHDNTGMVYSEATGVWYAIYLPSISGSKAVSVYQGTISDIVTWFSAVDYALNGSTRLLRDDEFTSMATGTPEAVNIYGSADPVTTGGHVSTASVRLISHIGCEDCAGVMYQWLDEQSYRFDAAAAHTHSVTVTDLGVQATSATASADVAPAWSWKAQTGGKGSLYTQGTYGTAKVLCGGQWNDGANAGSLNRNLFYQSWYCDAGVTYRFCCDNKEII